MLQPACTANDTFCRRMLPGLALQPELVLRKDSTSQCIQSALVMWSRCMDRTCFPDRCDTRLCDEGPANLGLDCHSDGVLTLLWAVAGNKEC